MTDVEVPRGGGIDLDILDLFTVGGEEGVPLEVRPDLRFCGL